MAEALEGADLERRAEGGDPDAQYLVGLRLLEGAGAMADGPRAIALIQSACDNGHAEAAATCALFEAMGAGRPQSWPRALDLLVQSAERGSASAQGQLAALAGDSDRNWSALRGRIAIERLLQAPARQILSDSPRIISYPGIASAAECEWVRSKASDRLQRAKVFHTASGDQTTDPVRDNSGTEFQLPQMDVVLEVLRARISAATRLPVPIFEPIQVLHYAVGEQFRPHHDFLDPQSPGFAEQLRLYGQRIATVLIYLNDGYEGGETVFPRLGISYRGGTGDGLFWTNVDRKGHADPMTMHAGTPPTSGEKWVISQWIRDRAPLSPYAAGATDS